MKKLFLLIAVIAVAALIAAPAVAEYDNTLYGQEGVTGVDGYEAIDASGQGPDGNEAHYTNWKYQYGNASWSGVYSWDGDAWLTEEEGGDTDSNIEIEADIEMYWSETISDNKIYFHIGNPFTATAADKRAYVNGTYATNHLMWVGISFPEEKDIDADLTSGRVLGGMVGSVDIGGDDISSESFDVLFSCRVNDGAWTTPGNFGEGAHSTITNTLWWDPDDLGMTLGSGTFQYKVEIEPDAAQPDGNYELDPAIVRAPVM